LNEPLLKCLSERAQRAPASGISEIVTHGRLLDGLIPLWVGEGDLPTPDFVRKAGMAALEAGETFYTWNRGIPELRDALARYHEKHFGRMFAAVDFLVTGSGMQAIQLTLQAITGNGDEIVYFTPAWPNFAATAEIAGAVPVPVVMDFGADGWSLDLEKLRAALTARTKAIFVNSPANPTGWTADIETLVSIRDFARAHGLWIVADEIYSRFFYSAPRAPSFMDIADEDDRIIFVNSFSKNWAMTGWRIGWIKAHPSLSQMFENLIQYSTSGVAQFMQRGAVAALEMGDGFVDMQVARARIARDLICAGLAATGRVKLSPPPGAFYLYFEVDGIRDTRLAAKQIVEQTGVGLAPGAAFGPGGASGFRLCFNRRLEDIETATERLANWIGT
jgi:aspartate/methionine/tyrosine aminotransferase